MKILAGRPPARRRHRRARRRGGLLQPPGAGAAGGRLHGLPGVQPAAGAHRRREHLPRPRAAAARPGRHARMERDTAGAARRPRRHRASAEARVRTLSVAEQQVVEIAKAISYDARIISMDEPTAALADHEVELLYSIIRGSPPAASRSSTSPTGSRRSSTSATPSPCSRTAARWPPVPAAELDDAELVRLMVGRSISSFFPDPVEGTELGEPRLELARRRQRLRRRHRPHAARRRDRRARRAAGLRPHRAARGASSASARSPAARCSVDGTAVRPAQSPRRRSAPGSR